MDQGLFVEQELLPARGPLTHVLNLVFGVPKLDDQPAAARLKKVDFCGPIPNDLVVPEILHKHHHIKRIGHGVNRSPK